MNRSLLLAFVLLLASCAAPFTLVEPTRQTVAGALSVQPTVRWNHEGMPNFVGRVAVWTLDGPQLNELLFIVGVQDGEPLLKRKTAAGGGKEEAPPVFRSKMTHLEIQELFQAEMARGFDTTIADATDLKPALFIGVPGFRFETRFVGRDEVERQGTVVGAVRDGKLYAMWFYGARLHYYHRYLPEFDALVASARLAG